MGGKRIAQIRKDVSDKSHMITLPNIWDKRPLKKRDILYTYTHMYK